MALGEPDLGRPPDIGAISGSVRLDLRLRDARELWVRTFEREYVARLLAETGGNIAEAARRAGVDRAQMSRLAGRHGLRRR